MSKVHFLSKSGAPRREIGLALLALVAAACTATPPETGAAPESLAQVQSRNSISFQLDVNFQPASSVTPQGYVADSGATFGDRGNGSSYGWSRDLTSNAVE